MPLLARWSFLIGIALYVTACGGRGKLPRGAEHEPTNARCLAAFGEEDVFSGAIVRLEPGPGWASFLCTAPIKEHPDLLMIVVFYSPPSPGQPLMQLRVGAPTQRPDHLPSEVIPMVVCDLTMNEVNQVVAQGIPEALASAMVAKMKEHQFKTQGPKATEVLHFTKDTFFRIEPGPYFAPPAGSS